VTVFLGIASLAGWSIRTQGERDAVAQALVVQDAVKTQQMKQLIEIQEKEARHWEAFEAWLMQKTPPSVAKP
jgi:hypothetical protein